MEFFCYKCGKCCTDETFSNGMVLIYPAEVKRLADATSCSSKEFLEDYCVKDYILVDSTEYEIYKLKKVFNHCIFLNENLCNIYKDRPTQWSSVKI